MLLAWLVLISVLVVVAAVFVIVVGVVASVVYFVGHSTCHIHVDIQ